MSIQIDILNRTTVLKEPEIEPVLAALDIQINRDYKKYWGEGATLHHVPQGSPASKHHWWIALFDNSDMARALGYHDVTSTGMPLGKVFVKTTMDDGGLWTVTLSHEILEMLADPEINLIAQVGGKFVAYENCDACERDNFGYSIDSVTLSDFVTPLFFSNSFGPNAVFDFQMHIQRPLQILHGGYLSFLTNNGWTQVYADRDTKTYAMRPPVGSRRERRRIGRDGWLASSAE